MQEIPSTPLWPLLIHLGLAFVVAVAMVGLSSLLGGQKQTRATREPFEAGIVPTKMGGRFPIKYFRVALFFLIFDVETVFIVTWALAARESAWMGYLGIAVFIAVLLLTLFYLWRVKALDWGPSTAGLKRADKGA